LTVANAISTTVPLLQGPQSAYKLIAVKSEGVGRTDCIACSNEANQGVVLKTGSFIVFMQNICKIL